MLLADVCVVVDMIANDDVICVYRYSP